MSPVPKLEEAYLQVRRRVEARAPAENVAAAYWEYLKELPFRSRSLVITTLTFGKGVMNYIPRRLVPALLTRPEFYERYAALTSYSEEVEKKFEAVFRETSRRAAGSQLEGRLLPKGRTLVATPSFEPTTHYGSNWIRKEVVPTAHMVGPTRELFRSLDNRPTFAAEATARTFICGVGHGNTNVFTGQFMRILWEVGKYNRSEVEGKIIKLVSCLIARELGPDLVDNGALAFQGYSEEYAFMLMPRFYAWPLLDKETEKFLETYTDACNLFLRGGTNEAVYQLEKGRLILNAAVESDPETRALLLHDASALTMFGDPDARIPGD